MPHKVKFMKTKWFPRPHQMDHSWEHSIESSTNNFYTNYPLIMYDEGLGAPSAYEANPEHASFVETNGPNCFPESRIDNIFAQLTFSLTKGAITTDALPAVKCCFLPVFVAFDDALAIDELSSLEVQDVLEIQRESTDRQTYPLFNNVNMLEHFANSALLDANVPGLTTTQQLEGVSFSVNEYYDMLQYLTNSAKLKVCQGGLKWITLTETKPIAKIKLRLRPKVKSMNEYAYFGVIVGVPPAGGNYQYGKVGDSTADLPHVNVIMRSRANEWNQEFNMARI